MAGKMVCLDTGSFKDYITKDVFMRERFETLICCVRGACTALADRCDVPPDAITELVVEHLIDTADKPAADPQA